MKLIQSLKQGDIVAQIGQTMLANEDKNGIVIELLSYDVRMQKLSFFWT
jgi:hypothetical protein